MSNLAEPLFFNKNRVRRVYSGGRLFADFFGDDSTDGFYPEEWICSSVRALNEGSDDPREGLSRTKDGRYFDELLEEHPEEMLGPFPALGILVKILDSAIRLPVQTHPDKDFSRKHFNSEYGKAESWIVLATRENACVYFGFKEGVTRERFDQALDKGGDELVDVLNRVPVEVGDVFFVPAKAVHAIGAGCLILEVQEPTDFTIQPEKYCGDYLLSETEQFLGLSRETAMECFDMSISGQKAEHLFRRAVVREDGVERLITPRDTPCFSVNRFTVDHEQSLTGPAVYVVIGGEGRLTSPGYHHAIRKGDYFFVPHSADSSLTASSDSYLVIIQCLPPQI